MRRRNFRFVVIIGMVLWCQTGQAQDRPAPSASPPDGAAFSGLDTNGDGFLTHSELDPALADMKLHLRLLLQDADGDGKLNAEEWSRPGAANNLFRTLDADRSGAISESELLRPFGTKHHKFLRHQFLVFDQDHDAALSPGEFLTLPGLIPQEQRGPLADPVSDWAQEQIAAALASIPVPVPAAEIAQRWSGQLPPGIPYDGKLWDQNHNGQVDRDEALAGLMTSFGLQRTDGTPLRWASGHIFNGSFFAYLDQDGDGRISKDTFLKDYFAGPDSSRIIFQQADRNNDRWLNLQEIDDAGLLRTDVPSGFLGWDEDRNGRISPDELQRHAADWQRNIAGHLLPGFDRDGDGSISLREYQACPLGNPLFDWNQRRSDTNADGFLQFDEFFPNQGLFLSGLAREFFDRLDQNRDGQLGFDEIDFQIDEARLPVSRLLVLRDRDGDAQLSLAELFTPRDEPLKNDPAAVLVPHHQFLFEQADADHDGFLVAQELSAVPDLIGALQLETLLRLKVLPHFRRLDQDQNGQLSRAEWCSGQLGTAQDNLIQEFVICDFDASGALEFLEFACLPSLGGAHQRPAVPDPVAEHAEQLRQTLLACLRQISAPGDTASLNRAVRDVCPWLSQEEVTPWDADGNGELSTAEVQAGVERLFGLRDKTGLPLRRATGQVFDRRTWNYADKDRDVRLTREEFGRMYWKTGAAADADFAKTNTDGDGQLSLGELLSGSVYWVDTQAEFKRFDRDLDGRLGPQELQQQARPHEQRLAAAVFPGFDVNRDGQLSFVEFRACPLANPLLDYNRERWDLDHDGRLSLREYHAEKSPDGSGLSAWFFSRLDLDGDGFLSMREVHFHTDLKQLAPQALFQRADADGNLALSSEEIGMLQAPTERALLQQGLTVFDLDRDGQLSLAEFHTLPRLVPRHLRGPIADPLAEMAQEQIRRVLAGFSPCSAADLAGSWPDLPHHLPPAAEIWDFNRDGQINREEARQGLEIAYGLKRMDGQLARWPDGFVFNGQYFAHLDGNADGFIERPRFLQEYFAGARQSTDLFMQADVNHDDRLSLEEVDALQLLRTDVPAAFLEWDHNRDGVIEPGELQTAASWHRQAAAHLIPAFDSDRDGRISLLEYRSSPLGNPLVDWHTPRKDANADGVLQFEEFFPGPALAGSGLAVMFFDKLDLDQSGTLSPDEWEFEVAGEQLAGDRLWVLLDRDRNNRLSLLELFSAPGRPLIASAAEILRQKHIDRFTQADADGDGLLTRSELAAAADLEIAARREFYLRHELKPKFQLRDDDHNGRISRTEWLHGRTAAAQQAALQEFLICDFDADGSLDLLEFGSLPSQGRAELRPGVPDPIAQAADQACIRLLARVPVDGSPRPIEEVLAAARAEFPFLEFSEMARWDLDQDGRLASPEIRRGIESLYGLRDQRGRSLRREDGRVFNLQTVIFADKDQNGSLAKSEFLPMYWKQGAAALADFTAADRNGNGELSPDELESSPLFWFDPLIEFLRFDTDRDGRISPDELQRQAKPHEARLAAQTFPAFDLDGDGHLQFLEFRGCPLANPLQNYDAVRWDKDYDGLLSFEEYTASQGRDFKGLSALFFQRLDRNGDNRLSLNECRFDSNLKRELPEVAFQILDADADGRLTCQEILKRFQPRDANPRAQRLYERRAVELEEAFQASDTDRDQQLALGEFVREHAPILQAICGKDALVQRVTPVRAGAAESGKWNWRLIALAGTSLVLSSGLGWWHLRR